MISQYWFRWWLGAIRHQAITRANIDSDLCLLCCVIRPQWVKSWIQPCQLIMIFDTIKNLNLLQLMCIIVPTAEDVAAFSNFVDTGEDSAAPAAAPTAPSAAPAETAAPGKEYPEHIAGMWGSNTACCLAAIQCGKLKFWSTSRKQMFLICSIKNSTSPGQFSSCPDQNALALVSGWALVMLVPSLPLLGAWGYYYPVAMSCGQVFATHLKKGHL